MLTLLLLTVIFHIMSVRKVASLSTTFFEKLGSPRFISAPMVDHSSLAWRTFVKKNGCDLAYTEMLNSFSFGRSKRWRAQYSDWKDYEHVSGSEELTEQAKKLDSPLILQFAGESPELIVQAARFVQHDAAAIDLNLGCPQKVAKKGNFGAYLLRDKPLVLKILTKMVNELECPITAKIRIFDSEEETLDMCRAIQDCGVSMLTVHGRTIREANQFCGPANWDRIAKIKQTLSIPVIANGGIGCYADAINCLAHTGADGVMSSEALLENPKMFSEQGDYEFRNNYPRAQINTVKEFITEANSFTLPPGQEIPNIRGHLFKIMHRMVLAPLNQDLLKQLSSLDYVKMCEVVNVLEERLKSVDFDEERALNKGLLVPTGFYMRHRGPKPVTIAVENNASIVDTSDSSVQQLC